MTLLLVIHGGCEYATCEIGDQGGVVAIDPPEHLAVFRLAIPEGVDNSVEYGGHVQNASTDVDCRVAVFLFDREPDVAAIAPLDLDGDPPRAPAGGRLSFESLLPRATDGEILRREFHDGDGGFPIYEGDGPAVRWWAMATCGDALVDANPHFHSTLCAHRHGDPPLLDVTLVE